MQVEVNQCSSKQSTKEPVAIMNNTGMNIGINLSIFCILAIFLFILYVPLELLFYATKRHPNNYSGANGNSHLGEATTAIKTSDELASQVVEKNVNVDYQNLKICEKLEFEGSVKSIYTSNQDQNCSYLKKQPSKKKAEKKEQPKESIVTCTPPPDISERKILPEFSYGDVRRITNSDSISVTTNIIATLLIISAIAALVEVLRIRFSNDEETSTSGILNSRKSSVADTPTNAIRRQIQRQPLISQGSFELQGMQRSALRLLAKTQGKPVSGLLLKKKKYAQTVRRL